MTNRGGSCYNTRMLIADTTNPRYAVVPHRFWQKKSDTSPGPKRISIYGSLPSNREAYEIAEEGYSIYDRRSGTYSNYFLGKVGIETEDEGEQIIERLLNVKSEHAPAPCATAEGHIKQSCNLIKAEDLGDITQNDFLATYGPSGIEYHRMYRVDSKWGQLLHFRESSSIYRVDSKKVDLLVTPNHNLFVCKTPTTASDTDPFNAESTIMGLEAESEPLTQKKERGFLVFTTHDRNKVDATFVPVDAIIITQIRLCGTEEGMLDLWSKWEVAEEGDGRKPTKWSMQSAREELWPFNAKIILGTFYIRVC